VTWPPHWPPPQSGANSLLRQRVASLDRERTDMAVRLQQKGRQPPSAAQQASVAELSKQLGGLQQQLLFAQQEVGCRGPALPAASCASGPLARRLACCARIRCCRGIRCCRRSTAVRLRRRLSPLPQLEGAQRSSRDRDARLREAESQLGRLQAELKKVGRAVGGRWGSGPSPEQPLAPWPAGLARPQPGLEEQLASPLKAAPLRQRYACP
jgi:hypothetical protein